MLFDLDRKYTRLRHRQFLHLHRSPKLTLNIGAKDLSPTEYFPHTIDFDINYYPHLSFQADAHSIPLINNCVPQILCAEVLEHTLQPQRVIDECFRVLTPKGKLLLTTRFIFPLHDTPNDYFRFTKYGLKYLLRNWHSVDIVEEANTQITLSILLSRLSYQSQIIFRRGWINTFLIIISRLIEVTPNFFTRQFGDINRSQRETNVLVSGYYVVANK